MTRVVVLGHSAQASGAELALLRILPAVTGVDPLVVLAEDGPLVPMLLAAGIPTHVVPMSRRTLDVRRNSVSPARLPIHAVRDLTTYVSQLAEHLRGLGLGRSAIIHTNTSKAHLYGAAVAVRSRSRLVMHLHDRLSTDYLPTAAVILMRTLAAAPHAVVANSQSTLATAPSMLHRPRQVRAVVPNPAPTPAGRLPRSHDGFAVGMVGRISPWKGQDVFLRAFAQAFSDDPAVSAHLVGSALFGEQEHERTLHGLADALGLGDRVVWHGQVEDVPDKMAEFDLLVHASTIAEPFGQVVIEGMAAGTPVIATDAGGPAETIRDGHDGILVPPGDVAAMAAAMRRLKRDGPLRERLVAAGAVTAARYTPEAAGEVLGNVYRMVVSR